MTFEDWWDTSKSRATPDTYKGWEESCRQAWVAGRAAIYSAEQAQIEAPLRAEINRLRGAAEYAAHCLERARIWNGMDWHYNPLHPLHYRSALERLRDVLRAAPCSPPPP